MPFRPLIATWSLCLLASAGCGGNSSPAESEGDATAVIADFVRFHQSLEQWSVTSRLDLRLRDASGADMTDFEPMVQTRTILVAPGRFAIRSDDGFAALSGTEYAYVSSAATGRYFRGTPLNNPAELRGSPVASLFGGPDNLRILLLAEEDPAAMIQNPGEAARYIGRETLDGTAAHHVRVTSGGDDQSSLTTSPTTDIWIAAEGDPLLLKTVRTTPVQSLQFPGGMTVDAGTLETEVFEDWNLDPELDEQTFRPSSDTPLRRVSSLSGVFEEPARLLGEPAPDVDLVPIEGETQRLSALQGNVVLLDFWASWCSPCRDELPILAKLEEEYADRGVVLYAVNLGESPAEIQGVLRRELANVKAALDADHAIASQYDVGGIPHLAIIGPDGRVQSVHVGLGNDTEAVLREEIEALLAGVDLAKDGLPD